MQTRAPRLLKRDRPLVGVPTAKRPIRCERAGKHTQPASAVPAAMGIIIGVFARAWDGAPSLASDSDPTEVP